MFQSTIYIKLISYIAWSSIQDKFFPTSICIWHKLFSSAMFPLSLIKGTYICGLVSGLNWIILICLIILLPILHRENYCIFTLFISIDSLKTFLRLFIFSISFSSPLTEPISVYFCCHNCAPSVLVQTTSDLQLLLNPIDLFSVLSFLHFLAQLYISSDWNAIFPHVMLSWLSS